MYLEFDTIKEYESYFKKNKVEVAKTIAKSISEAYDNEKEEAFVFEIGFEGNDQIVYEVSVEKDQWEQSLEACLKIFTDHDENDEAIDTYLITKKIKQ